MLTVMDLDIGPRIRARRDLLGLKQHHLAEKCETSLAMVSQWETGHRTPSAEGLKKLAQALKCSTDYLLGLKEARKPKGEP